MKLTQLLRTSIRHYGVHCLRSLSIVASLGIGGMVLFGSAQSADAAEQVVFKYRWLQRTVPVADLSAFAETGETSPQLNRYLNGLDEEPETFRQALTREVRIDPVLLDQGLNHPLGNFALDQISPMIHTASGGGDRQALRAALVLSASNDDHISLIELIETYPTQEIHVEGERLINAYEDIENLRDRLEQWTTLLNLNI
ncbi:MAG: alpha/beta hydrolase [Cyanobacteria bacterium P01_E01_bin.6]